MSTPNQNLKRQWQDIFKNQIHKLKKDTNHNQDEDEQIQIQVLPSHPVPTLKQKQKQTSLSLYLNRKRYRNVQNVVNLVEQQRKPTNNSLNIPTNNPAPPKADVPITAHKRQRQQSIKIVQAINVEDISAKKNRQKYKHSIFRDSDAITASKMPISTRNASKEIQKQIQIINDLNKPEWVLQRQERRAINKQKYPNSFTHSYDFEYSRRNAGFSGMGSNSDKGWKTYLQKRQQHINKKKGKSQHSKQEKEKRKQEELKRIQQQSQDYKQMFDVMTGYFPKKKIKQNTQPIVIQEQVGLRNQSVMQQVNAQEQQIQVQYDHKQKTIYNIVKRQQRYGVNDIIKKDYHSKAPQLISQVLRHRYGQNVIESQNKKIPDIFQDEFTYRKVLHYFIINECIADLRRRLKDIQKNIQEPIRIIISNSRTSSDGLIQLNLQQKQVDKNGVFQLQNYSLSRYRLGLICSSKEYRSQYYGLPSKNRKQFAFIVQLVTPQTKQELSGEVKALSLILQSQLQLFLANRKCRQVNYFDLQKLTTHVRQYIAVTNMQYSELKPAILDPRLIEKQLSAFTPYQNLLDNILQHLKHIFNQTQFQSIREMVLREWGFVLLQGPPGTGKTSTLMGLLSAQYDYLKSIGDTRKIMICAPSNAAVDHIVRRISTEGLFNGEGEIIHPNIIRTGIVETEDPVVRAVSLDDQCEKKLLADKEQAQKMNNMSTAQIKEKIIALQKETLRLKNSKRQNQAAQKKHQLVQYQSMLFDFRRQKYINSKRNYNQIQNELLNRADIVLTTLASSGSDKMEKLRGEIACLIVDEAAQATEPNLLIALQTGVQKVLLIGDPYQLPATCISQDSNVTLFNRSLFQRMLDADIKPYFLNIQYRMAPNIRAFPSSRFYQGRLLDAPNILERPIPAFLKGFTTRNVIFIDLKQSHEQRRGDSYWNQQQTKLVSLLIRCFIHPTVSMGVITPYQAQRRAIIKDCTEGLRTNQQDLKLFENSIMINTVDSFQGQQRDIILVSTVRANSSSQVGFLTDQRRINVTLTRAKHLLVVIGHGDTLGSNQVWNDFLNWIQSKKCYYQIYHKSDTDNVISEVFQNQSKDRVRRRYHHKLSSDIRKMHRKQIQSKDFRSRKQQNFEPFPSRQQAIQMTGTFQNKGNSFKDKSDPPQDQPSREFNKYAIDIKQSEQILERKRQRQRQARQFQQALQRMNKFQEQNYSKLKNDGFYDKF